VLTTTTTIKAKDKIIQALEMEEFVILHQYPNKKNIVYSVQVVSGDANLTFALFPNLDYIFIIYCQIKQVVFNDTGRSNPNPLEDLILGARGCTPCTAFSIQKT